VLADYHFTRHLLGYAGYSYFFRANLSTRAGVTRPATSSSMRRLSIRSKNQEPGSKISYFKRTEPGGRCFKWRRASTSVRRVSRVRHASSRWQSQQSKIFLLFSRSRVNQFWQVFCLCFEKDKVCLAHHHYQSSTGIEIADDETLYKKEITKASIKFSRLPMAAISPD
jgi:hypothetical protein